MKYFFFTLTFILATSQLSLGQQKMDGMVIWGAEPNCASNSKHPTSPDEPDMRCDSLMSEGQFVYLMQNRGIYLSVFFYEQAEYLVANVYIQNHTGHRLLVDPQEFGISHFKTPGGMFAPNADAYANEYPYTPQQVVTHYMTQIQRANTFNAISAAFARQQATVQSPNGTAVATVTPPDYGAQSRAANQNATRTAAANQEVANFWDKVLLANTIMDDTSLSGNVYFKKRKKDASMTFAFYIEKDVFAVTLERPEKK